ncbi:MAG TPA: nuclear transport factor 2 family protein [Gemmatimonadales bacterium]|nr:nuclear transport factor 2 family protein [Gemmatimonadales bacterium]
MATGGSPLSRALPVLALVALVPLGAWVFFRSYGQYSTDECARHYKSARTAEDTARVDQTVVTNGSLDSCGFRRGIVNMWGTDSSQVHAIASGIIEADNRRELVTVLLYYADSAVLAPPGEAPVTGIAEIRKRYEGMFENWQPDIEPRVDEVVVTGSTATVRGHNGGWLRTLAAGATDRQLDDNYVMTLERRAGTWRIYRLQWMKNQ